MISAPTKKERFNNNELRKASNVRLKFGIKPSSLVGADIIRPRT